jgi:hypothetical protein
MVRRERNSIRALALTGCTIYFGQSEKLMPVGVEASAGYVLFLDQAHCPGTGVQHHALLM